jgi:hypothetical protein
MDADRRKYLRFSTPLMVQARNKNQEKIWGLIKDFSRFGLKVVFDEFDFNTNSLVDLEIQRPNENVYIPASAEVIWKRLIEGKWEAGLSLKEFPAQEKAEILEHGYNKWVADKAAAEA